MLVAAVRAEDFVAENGWMLIFGLFKRKPNST